MDINTLQTAVSCDSARAKVARQDFESAEEGQILMMKIAQCDVAGWNDLHPSDPRIVLVAPDLDPSPGKKGRMLFNTLPIADAAQQREAATIALSWAGVPPSAAADPLAFPAMAAAGKFTVGSYFDFAKRNDPVIIFFPSALSGRKLSTQSLKAAHFANIATQVQMSGSTVVSETVLTPRSATPAVKKETKSAGEKEAEKEAEKLAKKLLQQVPIKPPTIKKPW
jgi:hypothetical protein